MQFKDGTSVYTADDNHVGHIERVVIDPLTKEVTHVIVEHGILFTEDKVLPVQLVDTATDKKVTLKSDIDNLEELPNFEQTHYVGLNNQEVEAIAYPGSGYASPVYGYPPFGAAFYGFPGFVGPAIDQTPDPAAARVTQEQIPDNTTALREGARVFSADGEHVGEVEQLFMNEESKKATHLVISQGLFLKDHKLVPINWVKSIMEDEVHLGVQAHTLEELPEFQES